MCARSFGSNSGGDGSGSSSTANCCLHGSSIFIYDLTLKLNNMHYKHINRRNLLFDLPVLVICDFAVVVVVVVVAVVGGIARAIHTASSAQITIHCLNSSK